MSQTTGRNHVFGLMALRVGLISRETLDHILAEAERQNGTNVARLLEKSKVLTAEERQALEVLVDRQLARHGGNLADALQALENDQDVVGGPALKGLPLASLHTLGSASFMRSSEVTGSTSTLERDTATGPAGGPPPGREARYRLVRPHASGGLGMVWLAVDSELDRPVALKEMKGNSAEDRHSRIRFVREAEITGKLEHPGVVPIYSLGLHADGRPYYAMRFIEGQSLKTAIVRYHEEALGRNHAEHALQMRELLTRFIDVCNAIAYAHSRGVLHRDIKPGNVMLGPFGETLVVDWGLAKTYDQGEATQTSDTLERDSSVDVQTRLIGDDLPTTLNLNGGTHDPASRFRIEPNSDSRVACEPIRLSVSLSDEEATRTGAVLGTPFYMSPEQARGELETLSPASDIYSLGAVLYTILTGKLPSESDAPLPRNLKRLQESQLIPPRQLNRRVSRVLEAICLRAMAPSPAARYATAKALADDVKRYLADEAVKECREPLLHRVNRLARRHRAFVVAGGVASMVVLATLAWAYARELSNARDLTRLNRKLAVEQRRTVKAMQLADARLDNALIAIRDMISQASADALRRGTTTELQARLLAGPRHLFQRLVLELQGKPQVSAREQALLAEGRLGLGRVAELTGELVNARREYEAALEELKSISASDGSPARDSVRRAELHHHLGNVLVALGEPTQAASSFRQAVDHERLALYHDPGDRDALGRLDKHHERLGQSLRAAGQPLAAALVARQRLALKSRGDANALATAGIELAQCVELLQAGTPDERELATDFSNESIDLMQHAVEAGYRDVLQFVQVLHAQHADLRPQVKQMLAAWLDTAWPSNPFAH